MTESLQAPALQEWKQTGQKKWGGLAHLARADAIFQACQWLEAQGERIGREAVRALLDGGSDRDLAPVIELYKRRKALRAPLAALPESLLQILAVELDQHFSRLHQQFEALAEQEARAFGQAVEQMQAALAALEEQKGVLELDQVEKNAHLEALIEQLHNKEQENNQAAVRLKEMTQRYQQALVEKQQLQEKITEKERRVTLQTEDHQRRLAEQKADAQEQRKALIEQQEKELARLMSVHGNERGEWQRARRQLEAALDQAKAQGKTHQAQAEQQAAQVIARTKQVQDKEQQLAQLIPLQGRVAELEQALYTQQAQSEALLSENQRMRNQLRDQQNVQAQLDSLQTVMKNLQQQLKPTQVNKPTQKHKD